MSGEQNLLLEFLRDYSADALGKALYIFEKIRSGINVFESNGWEYSITVRSESNTHAFYNVTVDLGMDGDVETDCDCPAMERFGSCKHVAGAVIYILIEDYGMTFKTIAAFVDDKGTAGLSPADKIIPLYASPGTMPTEDKWHMEIASPQNIFYSVNSYGYAGKGELNKITLKIIEDVPGQDVLLRLAYRQSKTISYEPQIKYDRNDKFLYKCNCADKKICSHVRTAFAFLNASYGRQYFYAFKNFDAEKNALLKPYGLTVADKEVADITFNADHWGAITMNPPSWLWKTDIASNVKTMEHLLLPGGQRLKPVNEGEQMVIDFEIGFLFNFGSQHFKTGFELETVKVTEKNNKPQVKKLGIHQQTNWPLLKALPHDIYELVTGLSDEQVKKNISDQIDRYLTSYAVPWGHLNDSGLKALKRYYAGVLQKLWPYLCSAEHVFLLKEGATFSNANVLPARLSAVPVTFSFVVTEDERYVTIHLQKMIGGEAITEERVSRHGDFLFMINGVLHLIANLTDLEMIWQFEHGYVKVPVSGKAQLLKSVIAPLQQQYDVALPASFGMQVVHAEPLPQLLLKELDNKFLVLQPQYVYNGTTVNYEPEPSPIITGTADGMITIKRDAAKEQAFFDSLRPLHPRFQRPSLNDFFFLPFEDTMKQNWFIETIARLVADNITVLGMQDLKKHQYNTNKPKWEMKAGSGIDWFDLEVTVSFGDQQVSLRDIRKALLNQQSMVVLGDGTFGVLPEDWLRQYGLLLKMGEEQKDGTLRVSKLHYTLIDELHSQIDDEEILREINEKKQRLLSIGNTKMVKPGKDIKATLRPYQLSGFQWFQTLDDMGWGGCLADDMGLGKTLQTITFLQYLKKKYKGSTHLVICPTSLIYNWENELQKFAPTLKFHIYYGVERELSEAHFNDFDVIITSYGIIRNDIEELIQFGWHYLILDESQAIKNPDAVTNKALQLLKSKNRMILSGTPIQNNTYDLFAQFHFINPGLLGNREFFKTEFANPIDKNNDAEKTAQLRRLIYPFMLRRTKEQVATDLPDKTETILWCDMSKEQRAVYDEYKNYYRNTLLEKIEEVGMAKAGMYVLEGLLRLRQICDSPRLVKDSGVTTSKSVKIEELLREIEENTGEHKMLVFSQFTDMLHLIEDGLISSKTSYVYLDGSTPAEKRKEAVNKFQDDPKIRVFLISLKAGGVGLNLTAADYVYIVDPWWNPAVEQQAIDRTHRIGQSNKIFAYKMICKDTVEEKILQLQQRKKQLASDLVTEDAGFIKKLTKDDIAFLFS